MPRGPAHNQRRREEARSRILDGSIAAFAEKGFRAASMDDVAASAGVSKGLAYFYFKSKEDLFVHALRDRVAHLFDVGDRLHPSTPAAQRLAILVEELTAKVRQDPDLFRLYLSLSLERSLAKTAQRLRRELGPRFERYVAAVRDICADLGSPDPEVDALLLRSALLGILFRFVRGIEEVPLERLCDRLLALFAIGRGARRKRR